MNETDFTSNSLEYNEYGFTVVDLYNDVEIEALFQFTSQWIYSLLAPWIGGREKVLPLEYYHLWSKELPGEHRSAFKATHRYKYPEDKIRHVIINDRMKSFLVSLGLSRYAVWDDGWGDVGFRLIRPGAGDGYPFCAKEWGNAKGVVSFWIPIIGRSSNETLWIAEGSNQREHPKDLRDEKFVSEPRYSGRLEDLKLTRPSLKKGEVICYHPKTLHSEEVSVSEITRVNLEIRFKPLL